MKAHSTEAKSKYLKDKESRKAPKNKYVKSGVGKATHAGKHLTKLYYNVYTEALNTVRREKLVDTSYDAIYNSAFDSAVDLTMSSNDYQNIFMQNNGHHEAYDDDLNIRKDIDIAAELEKAFETAFDKYLKSEISKQMDEWLGDKRYEIYKTCAEQGERRVFSNYFEEFKKDIFGNLSSKAIDLAFSDLDENSEYSETEVEWELNRNYNAKLEELVNEYSEKSEFSRKIYEIVYDMINRKAIMWIKLNKPFTD